MQYSGEFTIVLEDNKADALLMPQNALLIYGVIRKFFRSFNSWMSLLGLCRLASAATED